MQEGCDKFCTFCVVPYTRGAEFSRSVDDVASEARRLVEAGAREITLFGQNVNAYHGTAPSVSVSTAGSAPTEWGLGRLIRHLAEIAGLQRIRYTTSHPRDMDDELIEAHATVPALMPFLHLPVQSGSDRVLAAMNRQHTADDYRRLVDRLRRARGDIALSSDFIVGHPGEDESDFEATLRLIDDIGYAQAYSFKYSPRPGTPAAAMPHQIPEPVKSERLDRLQALLRTPSRSLQSRLYRPHLARSARAERSAHWAARGPLAVSAAGSGSGRARLPWLHCRGRDPRGLAERSDGMPRR